MRLENKVAIITGASRGIGKATALLFAREGAKIIVNYVSAENEAMAVVDEIKKSGGEAIAIKCDVSNENEVQKMVNDTVLIFGKVDILINNAGIVYDVSISDRNVEQFKRTLDVNLLGNFLCSKYVSEQMLKQDGGKIVNVSSTNAFNNFSPTSIDYDASKAGIVTLTRDFAKQLAPSILVNAVAPSWVDTDMNKDLPEELIREQIENTYLKRLATSDEVAKALLFLASDDASYITGSVLVVDGGHN